jgi:glutamate/tyrosine decarboxylase-like PLP-dependent enzyme
VWKRVIAKRTQAASEAEGLRQATKKLKRSLLTSEEEARQLRGRLDEEAAARAEAEKQLKELQAKHTKLQEQHKEQNKVGSCCLLVLQLVDICYMMGCVHAALLFIEGGNRTRDNLQCWFAAEQLACACVKRNKLSSCLAYTCQSFTTQLCDDVYCFPVK